MGIGCYKPLHNKYMNSNLSNLPGVKTQMYDMIHIYVQYAVVLLSKVRMTSISLDFLLLLLLELLK